jgi:hypothetical protein
MNNGKVAVVSAHHALLLHGGLLAQCEFSITRPPPVGDRFVELYRRVRLGQDGLINAGITLPATISANTIPDEYSDIYYIRPQSIAALDLKLREDLLSLMESREFYQGKMLQSRRDSGLHLLDKLLDEQARADLTHASNTAVIDAKIRLENLRFETLASSHPSAFTEVRDELANLMLDLPEPERWPSSAIYDYFLRLLASLGDKKLGFAVRSSLTPRQMSEYDHEALRDAIVRRLPKLYVEEKHRAHINARGGSRASPSAAFLATDANVPNLKKDPVKNMRPSCRICGKTSHSESACFHNEQATCPVAIGRAPFGTPLHRKHNPNASGSQPPPRNGGRRKSTSSGSAHALAVSSSTTSERECEQALADTLGRCGLLAEDCG